MLTKMATVALSQNAVKKRRCGQSFGTDIVKSKKLLKYVDMQIRADTSLLSEQSSPVSQVNNNNAHLCLICSEEYETTSLLNIHQWDHTPSSTVIDIKRFTCLKCSKNYSVLSCFVQHMKNHHSNKHFCKYCSLSFHSFATMKHHVKEAHIKDMLLKGNETARFLCVFCPASYYSAKLLISHLRKYHATQTALDEYYPRSVVPDITQIQGQGNKINPVTKKRNIRLPLTCLNINRQISHSREHAKMCRPTKVAPKYNCNHCKIKFVSNVNLQKHQKQCHKVDKIFKPSFGCAKCPAKFFKNNFLKKHLVNHHGTNVTPKL